MTTNPNPHDKNRITRAMKVFFGAPLSKLAFDTFVKCAAVAHSLVVRPIDGVEVCTPTPLTREEFERVHDEEYVEALITGEPRDLAASNGVGWTKGLFPAIAQSNGALRDAVLHALRTRGIAGALSSGLHHARRERGAGYCSANGIVIAALAALDAGAKRVLILDFDAHAGGGTASLIAGIAGIEQVDVSVNGYDRYKDTPNARLVIARPADYLDAIEAALASIEDPTSIDVVIYNAGVDVHEFAGGMPGITTEVVKERECAVFAWARANDLPVAWTLAGGYTGTLTMDEVVDLHRLLIETAAAAA
jgi:acetoin utilization deacetylase AcuC-like enzyme